MPQTPPGFNVYNGNAAVRPQPIMHPGNGAGYPGYGYGGYGYGGYGYGGYGYPGAGYPGGGGVNLKRLTNEIQHVVRRGRRVMVLVGVVVFALAVLYTFVRTPKYQSYSLVRINSGQQTTDRELSYGTVTGENLDIGDGSIQAMRLQESVQFAEETANRLLEQRVLPGTEQTLPVLEEAKKSGLIGTDGSPLPAAVAKVLREEYVRAKAEAGGRVIRIMAESEHPFEAALIAQLYTDTYLEETVASGRNRIQGNVTFLERQVAQGRAELDSLKAQTTSFVREQGVMGLDGSTPYSPAQLAELEANRDEARIQKTMLENQLRELEAQYNRIQPNLVADVASGAQGEIALAQEELAKLDGQLERIFARNPDLRDDPSSDPNLQRLVDRRNQQQARVNQLSQQYVNQRLEISGLGEVSTEDALGYASSLKGQIEDKRIQVQSANARLAALERNVNEYETRLRAVPEQNIGLAQLERERQAAQERYMGLIDNLEKARLAERSEIGLAEVERAPLVPDEPVGPGKALLLVLGLVMGGLLGFVAAVIQYKLDTKIYTPDDVREQGINLLGAIPDMQKVLERNTGLPLVTPAQTLRHSKSSFDDRQVSSMLISLLNPISVGSDAYRRLFVNIQFSREDVPVQTVLVTSAEAEVGKSTTALNLAIVAAQSGKKTLVIDADLYRPAVYDRLGLMPGSDVTELLKAQEINVEDLRVAGIDNLYAVTSRRPIVNAVEVITSGALTELLMGLKPAFDVIVVDSPPILLTTGSRILSRVCDVTVLVVGAGTTDAEALQHVVGELKGAGVTVTGVILNQFDPGRTAGYKATYGYRQDHYNRYYNPTTA